MSDAHGEGGGSSGPIFLIIVGLIVVWVLAHGSGNEKGLFGQNSGGSTATSSSSFFSVTPLFNAGTSTNDYGSDSSSQSSESLTQGGETITETPTRFEIESRISDTAQGVTRLKEDMRTAKLWGVVSPYRDIVTLSTGDVWSENPKTEYLVLSVHGDVRDPVDITDWRLESTVTGNRARIGFGVRLPRNSRVNTTDRVRVDANESAYLVTGESPTGVSFYENKCTGYLAEHQTFSPPLSEQCPFPLDDMKQFGHIDLDNDNCYQVVQSLPSCRTTDEERTSIKISNACKTFIANDLTYAGCVKNHNTDPFFYTGPWRVYLEEDNDLWRKEREIIRLLDGQNRTVAVLEY